MPYPAGRGKPGDDGFEECIQEDEVGTRSIEREMI
jgi:hypothetical protein